MELRQRIVFRLYSRHQHLQNCTR